MKKHVLFVGFLFFSCTVWAQNKTLGVGVTTPNANAALHVESPTGNQGFILPRLTTAQRTASGFVSVLGAADNGLMVYDTSLKTIFIWDGAAWKTSAQVSGGPKLVYPYVDTVGSAPNNSNLFRLIYAGSGTENVGVAHFENMNPNSGFSAIFGRTNSATNGVADFMVDNPANTNDGIHVTTNGLGTAGRFVVNNASNDTTAIYASTNGTGGVGSAAIFAETSTAFSAITGRVNSGFSNAISGISNSTSDGSFAVLGQHNGPGPGGVFISKSGTGVSGRTQSNVGGAVAPVGVYGESTGTGSGASAFRIANAANNFSAVYAETNGTGGAGFFKVMNASNATNALFSTTNGQGAAGVFEQTNTGVWSPALQGRTDGQGAAIAGTATANSTNANASEFVVANATNPRHAVRAETIGTGNAGYFINNNGSNTAAALQSTTNGTGAAIQGETATGFTAIYGRSDRSTGGHAGLFDVTQAGNNFAALQTNTAGTGGAARFNGTNASATAPNVESNTNGSGGGFRSTSTGTGYSGWFEVNNTSNSGNALWATHNGTGSTFLVNHTGASGNLAIFQSNNSTVARIDKNGQGLFNGGTVNSGADVAEMFDVEGARNSYEPGDVLVISENSDRTVEKSNSSISTKVAGVYATKPGVKLTERGLDENMDDLVPMGVIGVIPTKVCLQNGAIKRGDLLVTSSKTGHAMKAIPVVINGVEIYPTGAILGKALENFDGQESGLIKVLVNVK
jgi:trimeric autotransporter adhesin